MAHITITQLNTILSRIVTWVTGKFAAKNVTSGKLEYSDMPVVVLASMGHELDGTDNDISVSVGDTYFLPAGSGTTPRIMYRPDSGNPVRISDPASGVIYCNAYTGLLYRWDASQAKMVHVGGSADGLRKVYVNQSDFSSLDALHSAEASGVYQVIDQSSQRIIGILVVSCDNKYGSTPHFVTQWMFSNLVLSGATGYSGSINGAHYEEGKAHIIHRFYNVSTPVSGNNNIPLNTWSEWKVYGLTYDELSEIFGNVVTSISVNGGSAQTPDSNGNVNIQVQGGNGNVSVIQPDPADGTFIIRVGDTDYIINLNHQHPEYAPLVHTHSQYAQVQVVNGESNLPDPLDPKTIYGVKAGGLDELEMVVIGGFKFYGGGGTPGQPVLMQPANGSSVSMGIVDNGPLDDVLDPKSKSVYIKARNITQPINVSVSGTGFSIENSVSQISAADASIGVNINVLFDGSASSQGGTLVLQSTELGSAYIDLTVEYVPYVVLDAVGLRGTQWIETDYLVNPNTNLKAVWQFIPNSNTRQMGTKNYIIDSKIDHTTGVFMVYFGSNASENNAGTYMLNVATDGKVSYNSYYQQLRFNTNNNPDATFCNKGTFVYSGTSASFNGKSITMVRQTRTANNGMRIGIKDGDGETPVNAFDIDIYSIEITEGETTVRNYIPVTKNGVAGLYDTVNGAFHASASGTPLVEVTSNNS